MQLDIGTIIAVMSGIQLLFAALFALVSAHSDTALGARQWAVGALCIGCGFVGVSLFPRPMHPALVVSLAALAGGGVGALFNGIEAFNGKRQHHRIPFALALLFVVQNVGLGVLFPDEPLRLAANSLVYGAMYAACARALLVPSAPPLRTAYVLASAAFALFAALALLRAATLLFAPRVPGLFYDTDVHPLMFLFASLAQMATSLALALLITYRLSDDLRRLASTDALTNLLNRRSFEQEGARMLARAVRTGEPLSALMIDVDYFKAINDRNGHQAGDEVLRQLAATLRGLARSGDCLARYGGEEFCVLLPGANEAQAGMVAERLRERYADMTVEWKGKLMQGTVSIGVADTAGAGMALDALVTAADQSLYRAKAAGRNRVAHHTELLVRSPFARAPA